MDNSKRSLQKVNLKAFRICNGLYQKDIAEYLDVTATFISAIERGNAKLPMEHLEKLLNNDRNWDTSPLCATGCERYNINNGTQTIGSNFENASSPTVNNFNGYSQEDFERELQKRLEIKEMECKYLRSELESKNTQIAFLTDQLEWLKSHCDDMARVPVESRVKA